MMGTVDWRSVLRAGVVVKLSFGTACVVVLVALGAARAGAAIGPAWSVEAKGPTFFVPGKGGSFEAAVTNSGDEPANAVTITDALPVGARIVNMSELPLSAQREKHMLPVELRWCGLGAPAEFCGSEEGGGIDLAAVPGVCATPPSGQEVECSLSASLLESLAKSADSKYSGKGEVEPGQYLSLVINVMTSSSSTEGPLVNEVKAAGGAAEGEAKFESDASPHPSFGVKLGFGATEAVPTQVNREHWAFLNRPVAFSQAGGHPGAMTTTVEWATEDYLTTSGTFVPTPVGNPKDVYFTLPEGLLGNPTAVPRCPITRALSATTAKVSCPAATQIGTVASYFFNGQAEVGPIYNITPEAGQTAEFLLTSGSNANFVLTGHLARVFNPTTRHKEYTIQVDSNGIPNIQVYKVETTIWGNPASEVHNAERGLTCFKLRIYITWECRGGHQPSGSEGGETPFLTWQSDCSLGAERALIESDSWEAPVRYNGTRLVSGAYATAVAPVTGAKGCNLLSFAPTMKTEPDTMLADAPVGLGLDLEVPQFEEPERLAAPELRRSVISLPPGLSINSGIVDGVQACNEFGREGINMEAPPSGPDESEEVGLNGALQLAPGHCPDASVLGTAEAETPLLGLPVKGHVYLARPSCGNAGLGQAPCTERDALDGNMYRLYLELGGTGAFGDAGVNIKVRLDTQANLANGQLTAVAEEIAQLPFSKLIVHLNGGPRAPLANPATCGPAVTTADFSTWAAPGTTPEGVFMPGLGDATPSDYYNVEGCASLPGLAPGFIAGTVTPDAGKFTAFTVNISRKDREQYIKGVQLHTPPGLLGVLANVPLCGEADANAGTCPEASKVGTTRVATGAGSHPFEIEGSMYLTGPHDGAPFGLSIVTDAIAGPFNLGKVVVRARIDIDPHDSSLTITTDETGPYAVPQIIFGVPLRLQRITVEVNRPDFMFNPTNCEAQRITASISGSQEAVASVSSPFAVGGCKSLAFKPVFTAFTSGRTSRKVGASLDARLSYPKNALGNDANVAYVKVSLPKQLPSFLKTLQKACPVQTFDKNAAQCPAGSIIGVARADSPLLPVLPRASTPQCAVRKGCLQRTSVAGPVYFVSHGGEQFPQLIVVLQGDGVRVDLVGDTFIGKGITSSTFKTVPDVPVNNFELYLPQGLNHALAANGNLCKQAGKLVMPTTLIAQNGATVHEATKISVSGCARQRRLSPAKLRHQQRGKASDMRQLVHSARPKANTSRRNPQ